MKKSALLLSLVSIVGILLFQSCKKDSDTPPLPLTAAIFKSVQDTVVSFAGLTQNATEWFWDFGDGQTSTEQAPVHTYAQGGYYIATLKAFNSYGDTATAKVHLTIRPLPPYACLTGDYIQDNYKGKTWKLTRLHSAAGDYMANADAGLSVVSGTPNPLPDGFFDTNFAMGDIYKDTYTFSYDGSYQHDVKDDGAAFGGIVYQFVLNGGASRYYQFQR